MRRRCWCRWGKTCSRRRTPTTSTSKVIRALSRLQRSSSVTAGAFHARSRHALGPPRTPSYGSLAAATTTIGGVVGSGACEGSLACSTCHVVVEVRHAHAHGCIPFCSSVLQFAAVEKQLPLGSAGEQTGAWLCCCRTKSSTTRYPSRMTTRMICWTWRMA